MKHRLCASLTGIAVLCGAEPACAAWLVLCNEAVNGGNRYITPDGRQQTLLVTDAPIDDCQSEPIDAPGATVRWSGLLPDAMAARLDRGVSLLGDEAADEIAVSEIIPSRPPAAETPPARPTMRMGVELLPTLEVDTFTNEDRATASVGAEGFTLTCAAGAPLAGASLSSWDARLPVGARINATVRYQADADFDFALSPSDSSRRESPEVLAKLAERKDGGSTSFSVPTTDETGSNAFAVLCPGVSAELTISSIVLRPTPQRRANDRSTWVWAPGRWSSDPEGLVRELSAAGMAVAFVTVPLSGTPLRVAKPDHLAGFIELATTASIEVWAVEGDPAAVTTEGRRSFVARARALAAYNASRQNRTRLSGVQYDIEPYLLPGFDLAREAWLAAYVEALDALRSAVTMPMEVAVPFWWSDLALNDRPILEAMTAHVDGITVMNYRTDSEQLRLLSTPFLEWGARSGRYVRIAIEVGPLSDQTLWNFRPDATGRLWQRRIGGRTALILWDLPAPNPGGQAYARAYDVAVPASGTTFFGRRDLLAAILPRLSVQWSAWPSYAGVALHEYLSAAGDGAQH